MQPLIVLDFMPGQIGHVEYIDDLIQMRPDLRHVNRQLEIEQHARDRVQQPSTVEREDVDDREPVRRVVVDTDLDRRLGQVVLSARSRLAPEQREFLRHIRRVFQ